MLEGRESPLFISEDRNALGRMGQGGTEVFIVMGVGYPVVEVSQRLGVSQHSLYEWKKKFAASNAKGNDEA
jgi:hypothetical protein